MGADEFVIMASGRTAAAAFNSAVREAKYENGHGGYTGTIAEKHSFVMIDDTAQNVIARLDKKAAKPFNKTENEWQSEESHAREAEFAKKLADALRRDPKDYRLIARALLNELDDPRVSDKWGDAGCIKVGTGKFLFFGMASS